MDDWLLLVHVLAGMVWIGGIVVLGAIGVRAVRDRDPDAPARFSATLRAIGPIVLAPAPVLLVGFGVWLVADSRVWAFDQRWVQVGLGLFGVAFLVGAAHQSRTAIAAGRASARGDRGEAVRQLRRWLWGTALIVVLLVAAVWDMIFKPGL
jgi:uncharacterized membrane protein